MYAYAKGPDDEHNEPERLLWLALVRLLCSLLLERFREGERVLSPSLRALRELAALSSSLPLPPLDVHVALVHDHEEARAAGEPHDEVEGEVVTEARQGEHHRQEQRLDSSGRQRAQDKAGGEGERCQRQHGWHDRSEGAASHGQGYGLDEHRLHLGSGSPSLPLAAARLLQRKRRRRRRLLQANGGAARRDRLRQRRSVRPVQRRLERSRAKGQRQRRHQE
eukprot:scaffold103550_cov63-Phaeocystis_antarctica.AAC.2